MSNTETTHQNWFQKKPRTMAVVLTGITLLLLFSCIEYFLQSFMGLGNPVIYRANPFYGYRPLPNQEVVRFFGAKLKFNNLGIRADQDWDENVENKILFLGDSITYGGSYIANNQLFSHLAGKGLDSFFIGNAGVNGWGIKNIYGLIVDSEFLPAKTYITVVPEADFYRERGRLIGLPFWSRQPRLALEELFFHYIMMLSRSLYSSESLFSNIEITEKFVEQSVVRLKQMDEFLKSRGFTHKIYISADSQHLFENKPKDPYVLKFLSKHHLEVTYLIDRLKPLSIDPKRSDSIFYDIGHLDVEGHEIWGKVINEDLKMLLK
ncbi:MAG: hypothetical protein HQM14_19120 [SAR324 cluster bacterium]|nr:hypothetical protein [SAR324 cluster bacterium]